MEIPLHIHQNGNYQEKTQTKTKQETNRCWQECGEIGTCALLMGIQNGAANCGKQYDGSSKKLNIKSQYDPSVPLLGMYSKELKTGT